MGVWKRMLLLRECVMFDMVRGLGLSVKGGGGSLPSAVGEEFAVEGDLDSVFACFALDFFNVAFKVNS